LRVESVLSGTSALFHYLLSRRSRMTKKFSLLLLVLTCLFITYLSASAASKAKLDITFLAETNTPCDSNAALVCYTGGVYDLIVQVFPANEKDANDYKGVTDWKWPKDLVIKVGKNAKEDNTFKALPALLEKLHLDYYVTRSQAEDDSTFKATGKFDPLFNNSLEYHFSMQVPDTLAGSFLCCTAEWKHPKYGLIKTDMPICVKVLKPCNKQAENDLSTRLIRSACDQRKDSVAIALADKFIAAGWRDQIGLLNAKQAAESAGRFDDAIRYLDLCFETYHTVSAVRLKPSEALTAPTDRTQALYDLQHKLLVQQKESAGHK
jgi:hypothetical protein